MKIDGAEAANYDAIRLDSFAPVNRGTLVSADEENGAVCWTDVAGETKTATLGARQISIIRKGRR